MATDGYAVVVRRLGSPDMSHTHTRTRIRTHTFYHCGGTQLAHSHILFVWLLSSLSISYKQTRTHTLLRCVCVRVCTAIVSNHVSVLSRGVCQLPPPGWPICVVVAVMVMVCRLSLLPAALSPMSSSHSLRLNNEARRVDVCFLQKNPDFCIAEIPSLNRVSSKQLKQLSGRRLTLLQPADATLCGTLVL